MMDEIINKMDEDESRRRRTKAGIEVKHVQLAI